METTAVYRTDQADCYDANGAIIPCRGTGQDGELRCGAPWPEPRFISSENTVVDRLTGLMWCRSGALETYPMTWEEAFAAVERMNCRRIFGFVDWRLPKYRELFSLISHRRVNPALPNPHPFMDVFNGYYWTATTCSRLPLESWYVHLGGGRVFKGMKHGSYMLWPVRRHLSGLPNDNHLSGRPVDFQDQAGAASAGDSQGEAFDRSNARYEYKDQLVVDRATGLMWRRDALNDREPVNWNGAFAIVKYLNRSSAGGFNDWRMPNIRELESLVDLRCHSPALPNAFRDFTVPTGFWASTTSALDYRYAWVLYIQDGALGIGFKVKRDFHLMPVRSFGFPRKG